MAYRDHHDPGYTGSLSYGGSLLDRTEGTAVPEVPLDALLVSLPVAVASFDASGRVLTAAGGGYALMGLRAEDTIGVCLLDPPSRSTAMGRAIQAALDGQPASFTTDFDGHCWHCHAVPAPPGKAAAGYLLGTEAHPDHDDPSGRPQLEQVLESAPVCVASFDTEGTITYAAGSGYLAAGVDPASILGQNVLALYGESPVVVDAVRRVLAGADVDVVAEFGRHAWDLHYRAVIGPDGAVTGGLCTAQDATGWTLERRRPSSLADADPKVDLLTGLLSHEAVADLLSAPVPGEEAAAVLVDLDAFAVVNEAHGHAAGDTVLVTVAERLRDVAGTRWAVGRWGDDVFALVRRGEDALAELPALVQRVLTVVRQPVEDVGLRLHVTASIGTATTATAGLTELLDAAGLAVHTAKREGRDRVQPFHRGLQPATLRIPRVAAELRAALEHDQVGLHYQPVVRLSDRRAISVEALARWSHPERGLLMPDQFIPIAERTGLIISLGERLLRQACHAAAAWQRTPPSAEPLTVAVNLSARQLLHPGLTSVVRDAVAVSGCDPHRLVLEVTETALATDLDVAVATLTALKELGISVALDDFGTGYSSLVYLKRFPVDVLKIDRRFVAGLGINSDDTAIVASLISLAHSIDVRCIAEGVETAEQLLVLESMGCDAVQGYVFSRALDPAAVTTWLGRQPGGPHRARAASSPPPVVERTVVQRIFDLHGQGASLHTIAARLNIEGRRTDKGTRWHHTTVAQVIAQHAFPET